MKNRNIKMNFGIALSILLVLAAVITVGFSLLKLPTIVVFSIAIVSVSLIAYFIGYTGQEIQDFFIEGVKKSSLVLAILIAVGAVVGTWIISGVVPSIIYYGLKIIHPSFFLLVAFLLCCIASIVVGSSYTATATFGVALMGIGLGLQVNPAITAGAVISGSIFGDKMSPFSDTTNLAPAVAETDIFSHIRSMLYTSGPAFIISSILYLIIGFKYSKGSIDMTQIDLISDTILNNFNINPLLLLIPIITVILAIKKVPVVVSLVLGALSGLIAAIIFQNQYFDLATIFKSIGSGVSIDSGVAEVDKLLNRGGISSMLSIVALSIFSLGFGEILQKIGVLSCIMEKMQSVVRSSKKLILSTLFTSLITNMLTGSQYMAIVLPGELLKPAYKKAKIQPYVLSRTLEDGGTIFTFLVPWSIAAIYVSGVLNVPTVEYLPYCFFAVLSPIIAALYGIFNIAIFKISDEVENMEGYNEKGIK